MLWYADFSPQYIVNHFSGQFVTNNDVNLLTMSFWKILMQLLYVCLYLVLVSY